MIKHLLTAALLLLSFLPVMAQEKTTFTLEDVMWGGTNYWSHQPQNLYAAFHGETLLSLTTDEVKTLTDRKGQLIKSKTLFTADQINSAIDTAKVGKVYNLMGASFPDPQSPLALLSVKGMRFLYNWETGKVVWSQPIENGETAVDFHTASHNAAYVKNYNLYVRTSDGKEHAVSTDGNRELQYGLSVHRDEFGIHKGTFWNHQGDRLAFYRMDQTMVTDFPLIDNTPRVATLAPEKYPMAGMTSHTVKVGIYTPATGQTIYLQTPDPIDRYFTNIAWSPDGATVYVIELPRTQDKAEIVCYDANSGQRLKVLDTETNPRYVEPMHPIVFLLWDNTKFVYQSRRDGYNHLYLFSRDGTMVKQLTKGAYEVIEMLGFNEKTRSVIYKSNELSPIRHNHFSVNVQTGKHLLLDNGLGTHHGQLSAKGEYIFDRWTKPDIFRRVDLVPTDKNAPLELHSADSPWDKFNMPEITGGKIKAADGTTDLYYRLVKPVDFDPSKKYPAVVYVYGGPHAHNVDESFNYLSRPWELYMAQQGYAVFIVDNRGSEYRGFDFESVTHRRLGEVEMEDQIAGVNYLKSLPFVDGDRLGVHGWSFGGFMTTNLMCSYPEIFKVGVAGGPVIDWKYYEVMYGERYMDTPQENPDGYTRSSLVEKAGNLKGRLQIIVGYNDPTCVMQHSLSFLRACIDKGTQPDYFVYPGDGHNMMGHDMVHLHERITRYFDDHLK